jgi:GT2 family glycosyltransferase
VTEVDATLPVYVVHWNAPEWVRATVDSFLVSTLPTSIMVIDNGPYDEPLQLDERVRVMQTGENRGYTGGANIGIDDWLAGDAPFCVIACHDAIVSTDALRKVVDAARAADDYGIVAPRPHANVVSGPIIGASGPITDVRWVSGTCMLLRRTCIEEIGAFDESFGSYGEDTDLCYRANAAGWKIGLVDGATVRGQGSVEPSFRTQMYVNQIRLRRKHAGMRKAMTMLGAFPLLAARDALRWIVSRDPALLRRARGRLAATPAGARLLWRQRHAA